MDIDRDRRKRRSINPWLQRKKMAALTRQRMNPKVLPTWLVGGTIGRQSGRQAIGQTFASAIPSSSRLAQGKNTGGAYLPRVQDARGQYRQRGNSSAAVHLGKPIPVRPSFSSCSSHMLKLRPHEIFQRRGYGHLKGTVIRGTHERKGGREWRTKMTLSLLLILRAQAFKLSIAGAT